MFQNPAYSLYSTDSESDLARTVDKDLNKCARLLSVMLEQPPDQQYKAKHVKGVPNEYMKRPNQSTVRPSRERKAPRATGNRAQGTKRPVTKSASDRDKAVFKVPLSVPNDKAKKTTAFNARLTSSTPEHSDKTRPLKTRAIHKEVINGGKSMLEEVGRKLNVPESRSQSSDISLEPTRDTSRVTDDVKCRNTQQPHYYEHQPTKLSPENQTPRIRLGVPVSVQTSPEPINGHKSIQAQTSLDLLPSSENVNGCQTRKFSANWGILKYQLQEMRLAISSQKDHLEAERLLGLIQTSVDSLHKLNVTDKETELNLALQPLRSENCHLRRKARILNQQLREQKTEVEPTTDTFESSIQKRLQQTQEKLTKSQELNEHLSNQLETLQSERNYLVNVIDEKDQDVASVERDRQNDVVRLKAELRTANQDVADVKDSHFVLRQELDTSRMEIQQKELEIQQQQLLLKELRTNMTSLISDMNKAPQSFEANRKRSRILQEYLQKMMSENVLVQSHSDHRDVTPELTERTLEEHTRRTGRDRNADTRRYHSNNETADSLIQERWKDYPPENIHEPVNGGVSNPTWLPAREENRPERLPGDSPMQRSQQNDIYRTTELDNSVSTITNGNAETGSVMSGVTSTTTTSTVNEEEFRRGLDNLDAHIMELQNTLRATKYRQQ